MDHDPFDVFRIEPLAFRLVPLIYSAGAGDERAYADEVPTWPSRNAPSRSGRETASSAGTTRTPLRPAASSGHAAQPVGPGRHRAADNINNHNIASE